MFPIYYIFIVLAIGIAIIAEILVAYQKYEMKQDFREELERKEQKPEEK